MIAMSKGILGDHLQPRRNRGRKPAKNEGDVFSLLKREEKPFISSVTPTCTIRNHGQS